MQPPLQVIALNDQRSGNLAVAAPLEFGADVNQHCAVLHRGTRIDGRQPIQPDASLGEISVEGVRFCGH